MVGSSASNEYGRGGTVKATGFSSRVRFESELFAMSARKRPDAAFPTAIHGYLSSAEGESTCGGLYRQCPQDGKAPGESPIPEVSPNCGQACGNLFLRQRSPTLLLDARKRPTGRFNEDWIL